MAVPPPRSAHERELIAMRSILSEILASVAAISFFAFLMMSAIINGDASGGRIVAGRYYVANHGGFTEVDHGTFLMSKALGWLVVASFILTALDQGGAMLRQFFRKRKSRGE
jgi:hypothetical protein